MVLSDDYFTFSFIVTRVEVNHEIKLVEILALEALLKLMHFRIDQWEAEVVVLNLKMIILVLKALFMALEHFIMLL